MSKLIQTGYNPDYPVTVDKYWKYTEESAPPTWLTDLAIITKVDKWPILSTEKTDNGEISIKGPFGNIVKLRNKDSYIILVDKGPKLLSMTEKQLNLIYEEV